MVCSLVFLFFEDLFKVSFRGRTRRATHFGSILTLARLSLLALKGKPAGRNQSQFGIQPAKRTYSWPLTWTAQTLERKLTWNPPEKWSVSKPKVGVAQH